MIGKFSIYKNLGFLQLRQNFQNNKNNLKSYKTNYLMSRQHKKNIKLMIWWNIDDVQFLNREVLLWQEILPKGLNGLMAAYSWSPLHLS